MKAIKLSMDYNHSQRYSSTGLPCHLEIFHFIPGQTKDFTHVQYAFKNFTQTLGEWIFNCDEYSVKQALATQDVDMLHSLISKTFDSDVANMVIDGRTGKFGECPNLYYNTNNTNSDYYTSFSICRFNLPNGDICRFIQYFDDDLTLLSQSEMMNLVISQSISNIKLANEEIHKGLAA